MATIAEKLQYTSDAVDDIQAAINEKGVEVDDDIELGLYGDKIREINAYTDDDIIIKLEEVSDITDQYNYDKDYYSVESFTAFTLEDLIAETVEDITYQYSF